MAKKNKNKKKIDEEVKDIGVEEDVVEEDVVIKEAEGWTVVTQEQLEEIQRDGRLKGYNPKTKEALLN